MPFRPDPSWPPCPPAPNDPSWPHCPPAPTALLPLLQASEPGPAVDGCLVRIDRWPPPEGSATLPEGWPGTLTRRDATAYVRAVKHHGLPSHMECVVKEVWGGAAGAAQQAQPPPADALAALWHGLLRACEEAVAAQQAQQEKQAQQASRGLRACCWRRLQRMPPPGGNEWARSHACSPGRARLLWGLVL